MKPSLVVLAARYVQDWCSNDPVRQQNVLDQLTGSTLDPDLLFAETAAVTGLMLLDSGFTEVQREDFTTKLHELASCCV